MGKNNKLINSLNEIAKRNRAENVDKASNEMIPQLYAAMALALHRSEKFGFERINRVFIETQNIWESFNGNISEMVDLCEKETGIKIEYQEREDAQ